MTITLHLDTETENRLQAQVCDRGISLRDYLLEIAARQAQSDANSPELARKRLIDVLTASAFAGSELDIQRSKDYRALLMDEGTARNPPDPQTPENL